MGDAAQVHVPVQAEVAVAQPPGERARRIATASSKLTLAPMMDPSVTDEIGPAKGPSTPSAAPATPRT